MSAKCEWRLSELLDVQDNPFDRVVISSGLTVDLSGTEDEIFAGLQQSLRTESGLFNRGVTCELKDGGQDCLTCSQYRGDKDERIASLCRLGRDQRAMEQRLGEARPHDGGLVELAALRAEYMDMGEVEGEEELLARAFA